MIELLARKSASGDLFINLAKHHLQEHEWGLARMAILEGLSRGKLSDLDQALAMLEDICLRLSISCENPRVGAA